MSSDSDESLDSSYRFDVRDQDAAGVEDSLRRSNEHQVRRSPPSDERAKLDDLLGPAAVHPLLGNEDDGPAREHLRFEPPRQPQSPSIAASSLSLSSLSSFTEEVAVRPTLPPQIPALHRLNHLKNHMKQLKRLYRQEVQQEELAQRDALLQTLCTSSITMFRHCVSHERFFTAVRALLCQYLPALNSKLFEVEQFNGRSYLVAQTKEEAGFRDRDTAGDDGKAVELTEECIVAQWDRIGVAGRAAALTRSTASRDEVHKNDNDSLQRTELQAARSPSPMRQLDLNCIRSWRHSVAEHVVPCPNQHLVLQIPAAKLLQIGFRPEIDLAIPSLDSKKAQGNTEEGTVRFETRRRRHDRHGQEQVELRLLVVVLRDAQGGALGVFEAVVDSSARVSIEFLDVFGVLLASAIEMRRKVCRSMMGDVDVEIRRRSLINSPELRPPLLRVPASNNDNSAFGDWELVAFNSGAVLEEIDSAMLRAIRKPVESLLMESEAHAREITFHNSVVLSVTRVWDRLRRQLSSPGSQGWRRWLRSALAEMAINSDDAGGNYYIEDIQRIKHIRVLFRGESVDCYRTTYAVGAAADLEASTTLDREFEMLELVMESRQTMESAESTVQLTAIPVDVRSGFVPGDSTGSVIGVLVGLKSVDGDDRDLLRKVQQYLLPILNVIVQAYVELADNHSRVLQLENDLSAATMNSEHSQRALATSKAIIEMMEQWTATGSIEDLSDLVGALNASEISDALVAMKLFVVDKATESASTSDADYRGERYYIWTTLNGSQVVIESSISQGISAEDLVRIVTGRHDAKRQTSSLIQDSDGQWPESSDRGYHAIPLYSPGSNLLLLGVIELELSETERRQDVLSAIAPLVRLLSRILNMHIKVQSTQSAWDEQMNSLSAAHHKQWNNLMECATRWSQLPLSDTSSNSWREQISALCCQLLPSADFFNVFLNFGDDGDTRRSAVAIKLMMKSRGQAAGEDTRRELSLHNQCVLGAIAHYPLIDGDELLGVLVASKKSDAPFSEQDHQLMQLSAQLVSAQAITSRVREEARLQVKSLNDTLDQRSKATQKLFEAHASVSIRAQQLLMLLEVSRLGHEYQNDGAEHQAASRIEIVHHYLRLALQQVQSTLKSVGSREFVGAVIIDRSDQTKLSCLIIGDANATSEQEEAVACVSLDRDDDDAGCWYSTQRWMQHKPPFSTLPPRVLQLMGLIFQKSEPSHASNLITLVPVDLHGDDEHPTDDNSVVFLVVSSFEAGGLVENSFIGELAESIANILRSRLQVSQLNESVNHFSASVTTLESQLLELQQDYRLLELTNIVWMEVVGSSTDPTSGAGSKLDGFGETQAEYPIPSCLRRSFHERIVPFLREEFRICAVELVFDFAGSNRAQLSRRSSIACFMDSLDPSRAQALKSNTDSVILGSDNPSSINPSPRFWLVHRFLRSECQDPRCFGLFYIEWELHSPSNTDAAANKAKRTLVWLSDWLQTLAQYCFDRCSVLDLIYSGEKEVRELIACKQAQTDRLKVYAHWSDHWSSLLGFARALQVEVSATSATAADDDKSSHWGHVFTQLSTLSDTVIWARGAEEEEDMAWTIRCDGSRQCEKWSEAFSWPTSDSNQFQLITAASSTAESLGVIELVKSDDQLWSSEHAKSYRELLALIIGSYLAARRMNQVNTHERCVIQSARENLEAEVRQLRQDTAHAWAVYQQIEGWIQQLHPRRDARPAMSDCLLIRGVFGRIERQLVDASNSCENEISRARLLLQIGGGKDREIITSCGEECACHTAPSFEAMMKQVVRTSVSGDGTETVTVTIVPSPDSFQKTFPACESDQPMGRSGGNAGCVVFRVSSDAGGNDGNCTLALCVQMAKGDQKSVSMMMLEVLCRRLVHAISQLLQGTRERKHLSSMEQQLAAINCELTTEQRRSTQITAAMATVTRCVSEALSLPVEASDATITSAIEDMAKCLMGEAIVAELIRKRGNCENTGAISASPTAHVPVSGQIGCAVDSSHSLSSDGDKKDVQIKCEHLGEGAIDQLEFEVQGARILLTAPEPNMKADLSLLRQDKSALVLIVKLADTLVAIKQAKTESLAHRHEGDNAMAALQTEHAALEAMCLETKTALQRSEMQRGLMRASVKKMLEPIPTHAIEFMARLSSEACASRDNVIQTLGDALSEMYGVESVAIREPSRDANKTLYSSPSLQLGGKQPLLDSEQIGQIVDRCVGHQETEILSLKTGKGETTSTEDSHVSGRRWLIVIPRVVGTSAVAVLLLISSGQQERSSSRKDLYQVNHAQLLSRLATLRCEQLVSEAILTGRIDDLVESRHELDDALRSTNLQLERVREERCCYQQMLRGVTHDAFQGLSWSDKTWQKALSSTRKLVSVWQHLSSVLQNRISTSFASARNVRVRMFGVIHGQRLVFHLPTAATEFAYSTTMDVAAQPSTRRLWDALVNPISHDRGSFTEESNGLFTLLVPICTHDDSEKDDLPIAVAVVTIARLRDSEPLAFGDEHAAAIRDLAGELAPFLWGISRAIRPKCAAVQANDQHRDHRVGKQRLRGDGSFAVDLERASVPFETSQRGHLAASPGMTARYASNRPDEFDRDRDPSNQFKSIEVLGRADTISRDMRRVEETGVTNFDEDEDDSASTSTSVASSQGTPKKTRPTHERLVAFLLTMQRASSVKALQRLVADELKGVWCVRSSRSTPNVSFELVDMLAKDSNQRGEGKAINSMHSALLPDAVLNEVLRRINSMEPSPPPATPRLWKFSIGNGDKRTPGDEFWVAIFTDKAMVSHNNSVVQVAIGLLVIRGSRLQSVFSRHDEEVCLPLALQGLQQQLAQIRRDADLQAQISDSQRREADNIEQAATLSQMETRHRHLDAFSNLALRLSAAKSESELVRTTKRYLRDLLQCRRVDYEPSKRDISISTINDMQKNQESGCDEDVVVELGQSRCDEDDDGQTNNNDEGSSQQVSKFAASSTAVEMQHSIKLRVFSALSDEASSRLLGAFSAHLEPGAAPLSNAEFKNTLKSVATLVNASFHRLQALGSARMHNRNGKLAAQELERVRIENARLLEAQVRQRLSIGALQQQFEDLARVNSDIEEEVTALRSQLQHSEACRAQSEENTALAQQQLVEVAAAADKAQLAHDDVGRLQEAFETQQERVRVLEKKNMKRRLQVQQLAGEVGRLKKTEEMDKFRIAELEKQLAVAQQQQQSRPVERLAGGVGTVGHTTRSDASYTSRRRVSTIERQVDLQQEHVRHMQKLKQMRLAEELRCLAALEVRELNTRQGEHVRVRHAAGVQVTRTSGGKLKQTQCSAQPSPSPGPSASPSFS